MNKPNNSRICVSIVYSLYVTSKVLAFWACGRASCVTLKLNGRLHVRLSQIRHCC